MALGLVLLAYLIRFGYGYGFSDQDDVLPYVIALNESQLFATDWFVQTQLATLNVRTYVAYGLFGLSQLFPLEWVVGLLFVVAFGLIARGLDRIYAYATDHLLYRLAAVFIALVLTPQWTLGGNDLMHSMLVPSMLAWGLALHGLGHAIGEQWIRTAIFLGGSVLIQALVGLQVALVLGIMLLIRTVRSRQFRPLFVFSLLFLIVSSPMLVPLLMSTMSATPQLEGLTSIQTILAEYRAPHHYLATSFPPRAWIRFGLLCGMGMGAAWWVYRRGLSISLVQKALAALGVIAVILLLAVLFTLVWPSTFVLKLQLFKLTVLAKVVLIGLVAMAGGAIMSMIRSPLTISTKQLRLVSLGIGVVALGVFLVRSEAMPLHPRSGAATQEAERMLEWARTESPVDALFLIPPTWSGFRTQAQRSAVVTIKGFPFTDATMHSWYMRMQAVAPLSPDDAQPLTGKVDAAYATQSWSALANAADHYRASHIITQLDTSTNGWERVAHFSPWRVYARGPR
ncbi:MAG: hypothetical protein RhofKO_40890 [Rhodothermales bacterium]